MKENNKYKKLLRWNIILIIISVVIMGFSRFMFRPKDVEYTYVYVANRDITVHTELDEGMFDTVRIPVGDTNTLPNLQTDFSFASESFADTNILKGEYLLKTSYTTENIEDDFVYTMEISPTFAGDLAYGDIIDVYTIDKGENIGLLYSNKKVYKGKTISTTATGAYEPTQQVYIKVTKQEMLDYYSKLRTHSFIALPITQDYTDADRSEIDGDNDDDSYVPEAPEEKVLESYTAAEGDTWEDLANFHGISTDELKRYNSTESEFEIVAGMTINVPVNG